MSDIFDHQCEAFDRMLEGEEEMYNPVDDTEIVDMFTSLVNKTEILELEFGLSV